jgi:hypothetical protein
MMRDRRHRNKSHQSATKCIERQLRDDRARGVSFHSDVLRNASKCSALRLGSSTIHQATATTLPTTQRPHEDTQGPPGCRSRPVSAIQSVTVAAPILLPASANACKALQSDSIFFKTPCKKMQYFATECFKMFRFDSFTPVHPACSGRHTRNSCPCVECGTA